MNRAIINALRAATQAIDYQVSPFTYEQVVDALKLAEMEEERAQVRKAPDSAFRKPVGITLDGGYRAIVVCDDGAVFREYSVTEMRELTPIPGTRRATELAK